MSGLDLRRRREDPQRRARRGAARGSRQRGGSTTTELLPQIERIARSGGTPLLLARDTLILGVIHLKDILKPNMTERFDRLRAMGIRTVMITGDNPLTAGDDRAARPASTIFSPRRRRRRRWRSSSASSSRAGSSR